MKMMTQTAVLAMLNCPDLDERQANVEAFVSLIEHFSVQVIHDHEMFVGLADALPPIRVETAVA
jgi:hypothetical protein